MNSLAVQTAKYTTAICITCTPQAHSDAYSCDDFDVRLNVKRVSGIYFQVGWQYDVPIYKQTIKDDNAIQLFLQFVDIGWFVTVEPLQHHSDIIEFDQAGLIIAWSAGGGKSAALSDSSACGIPTSLHIPWKSIKPIRGIHMQSLVSVQSNRIIENFT